MAQNLEPQSNAAALERLAKEQKRYNTLLEISLSQGERFVIIHEEIKAIRKETREEFRVVREEMREEFSAFREEMREEFSKVYENQTATYEMLADMAQSISDTVLAKKATERARKLKQALA